MKRTVRTIYIIIADQPTTMDVIVMNEVSARELNTVHRERERKHKEIYVVVLERIYSRIKRCASVGMRTCWFEMPEVVFGYPMFDIERCIRFAMRHLAMNGFRVARIVHAGHDKVIDISWAPAEAAGNAPMGIGGSGIGGGSMGIGNAIGAPLAAAGVPTRSGTAAMAAGAAMAAAGEVSAAHLLSQPMLSQPMMTYPMLTHPVITRPSHSAHDHGASTIVSIKRRKPGGPGGTRRTGGGVGNNNTAHRPADTFVSHNILPSYAYGR